MNNTQTLSVILLLVLSSCTSEIPVTEGIFSAIDCSMQDCYKILEQDMLSAKTSTCAFYESDEELARLVEQKGKLIVDEDAKLNNVQTRKGEGLMHNKFCVINDSLVLTGSFNPRRERDDYNNMIVVKSESIAQHYLDVYKQLLSKKKKKSKHNSFVHNNISIEIYACPQDNCHQALLDTLGKARKNISFALFTFTDKEVADTLIEKYETEKVKVKGVVESWQSSYAQHPRLEKRGIEVCLEQSPRLQHNKVFVIDKETVITGSYNPTKAAYTINDESLIIIHSQRAARFYTQLIERINNASC